MQQDLGHSVLKSKTYLSYDYPRIHEHDGFMDTMTPLSHFKWNFIRRVRQAREDANFTQAELAKILRIKQDKYKWYETSRLMPHQYIFTFCLACHVTIEWLYTDTAPHKRVSTRRKRIKTTLQPTQE